MLLSCSNLVCCVPAVIVPDPSLFGEDDGICWLPEDPAAMAERYLPGRREVRRLDPMS